MLSRKTTKKWEQGAGKKGNLCFVKMKANANSKHPRKIINREPTLIPLCIDTGRLLASSKNKVYGLDELGIAISIYFKLLKSFILFFVVCSVIASPLYFLYSSGDVSKQATGSTQAALSEWTLGNIGETSYQCKQRDLKLYDTMTLWCPSGTKIRTLERFGLQKDNATEDEMECPQTIDNS